MSKSLEIGIVGLPNVGKSTLFNSLTSGSALVANYPFATIDPNVGIVNVPDDRLERLAKLYDPDKIVPATIGFTDIAGLVAGVNEGEGLGNKFLGHIRSCRAIIHVVRAFDDDNVIHVEDNHDPKKDLSVINNELVLADLQTLDKRLPIMAKEAKANPKLKASLDIYQKARDILDSGKPLREADGDWEILYDLQLLTTKPMIYVFNIDEASLNNEQFKDQLASLVAPMKCLFICAKLEAELISIDEADRVELLNSYGQKESGLNQLIKTAYLLLGLQSFLTAGKKEVRAWTVKHGSTAPQAAGVIHGDFERGFIAAEIVNYKDLIEAGSLNSAKAAGKVRTEGKTYIIQPDDIIEFKFNV